jgi:dihydropteroate synthase
MNSYVFSPQNSEDLVREFKKIGVDQGGMSIMLKKSFVRLIKLHGVASYSANILKQEMLSLGGDVALCRGALTGKEKTTDCLIMGNVSQLVGLSEKLKKQPFGLRQVARDIQVLLKNFEGKGSFFLAGNKKFRMGRRTLLMGIINMTPDSFSQDGLLKRDIEETLALAEDFVASGADILDIGGESTKPGAEKVSTQEELKRVMPILTRLVKKVRVPVSIDTTKSAVARAALDAGATIVNDISALRFDKKMAQLIARFKASVVLMHMQGTPQTMQQKPVYRDLLREIMGFLEVAVARAQEAGIALEKIVVDPGIGFGKTVEHNCEILRNLSVFKSLGRPVLVGLSRKSFIGKILGCDVDKRQWGTAGACAMAVAHGADIVRVHDVREMKQVLEFVDILAR